MDTEGSFAPETAEQVRTLYESLGPAAQTVVREVTKAMEFDREEYDERVTGDVVATARDALFASLFTVHVGSHEEFETWQADNPEYEITIVGNENVDRVVWHAAPFAERVVAATFQNKRDAAIATLRRQAYGRIYREEL